MRQNDDKFFAAIARADVYITHGGLQYAGDVAESGVAGAMAVRIIDALQVIEIEKDQRQAFIIAVGHFDLAIEPLLKVTMIIKTC